jgi:hypothetical protein
MPMFTRIIPAAFTCALLAGCGALNAALHPGDADPNKSAECAPSCYQPEPDARAEKEGCGDRLKYLCETALMGQWSEPAVQAGSGSEKSMPDCAFPKPPTSGKWVELSARARKHIAGSPDDIVFIHDDADWEPVDSSDGSRLRCVEVHWYAKNHKLSSNACGVFERDDVTCEPAGSKAARALNIAHYRLDEAQKLKDAGQNDDCQSAARQALAISRGLPKWKAQKRDWKNGLTYKTRYDGTLSEADLFAKVASVGEQASTLYKTCGGSAAETTESEEFTFTR